MRQATAVFIEVFSLPLAFAVAMVILSTTEHWFHTSLTLEHTSTLLLCLVADVRPTLVISPVSISDQFKAKGEVGEVIAS